MRRCEGYTVELGPDRIPYKRFCTRPVGEKATQPLCRSHRLAERASTRPPTGRPPQSPDVRDTPRYDLHNP